MPKIWDNEALTNKVKDWSTNQKARAGPGYPIYKGGVVVQQRATVHTSLNMLTERRRGMSARRYST